MRFCLNGLQTRWGAFISKIFISKVSMYSYRQMTMSFISTASYGPHVWMTSKMDILYLKLHRNWRDLCDSHWNEPYQISIWVLSIWFISTSEPLTHIELIHIDTILMGQMRWAIRHSWYGSEYPHFDMNHVDPPPHSISFFSIWIQGPANKLGLRLRFYLQTTRLAPWSNG